MQHACFMVAKHILEHCQVRTEHPRQIQSSYRPYYLNATNAPAWRVRRPRPVRQTSKMWSPSTRSANRALFEGASGLPSAQQKMLVPVPQGIHGGQAIQVAAPSGQVCWQVTVPDGLTEGQIFEIQPPACSWSLRPSLRQTRLRSFF